jgi:hypothetical protein
MNKRLVALAGSLVLAASTMAPAAAQAAAPAVAPSASAPAAKPAAVDPAVDKAVRELLGHLQFREQMAGRFQLGASQLPQIMLRAHAERINANTKLTLDQKKAELAIVSNDIPRAAQAAQKALSDPKLLDDAIDAIVPLYAAKLTLAELNELNAFQRRPVSVKMRSVMPQVAQETNAVVQRLIRERVGSLLPQKPAASAK